MKSAASMAEKAKGRKRHAVIDTMGNLLGIVVHAANIHDTKSGILAAQKACKKYPSIQAFCADAGYRGTCIDEVKVTLHNSAARLAMSFPPSASCKFLDLPPVNLRNLHLHLTKNPFASRPPHLRGVTLSESDVRWNDCRSGVQQKVPARRQSVRLTCLQALF